MNKIVIRGLAAILVAFALVACTTPEPEPEPDVISTFENIVLSYASAVPSNVFPSTGIGSATVTLNETQKTVEVSGTFENMSAPVSAAHIHVGVKGVASADIVTPLVATEDVTGTLSLEATTLTDDQITAMKAGNHYINVHTAMNPTGEIRGQISDDAADTIVTYVVNLAAVDNESTGTGKAVATLNKTAKTATLIGTYSGLTGAATEAHIHEGVTGSEILQLVVKENSTAAGSGVIGFPTSPVTDEQIIAMESGIFYINIETDANPDGEIRGDIK